MEELTYIIKRILQMIPVLLIITLIIFFGMRLIPGDPALLLVGNRASDEVIETMRTKLGLSEPLYVQYFLFLKQCLTFNFGNSLTPEKSGVRFVSAESSDYCFSDIDDGTVFCSDQFPSGLYFRYQTQQQDRKLY